MGLVILLNNYGPDLPKRRITDAIWQKEADASFWGEAPAQLRIVGLGRALL